MVHHGDGFTAKLDLEENLPATASSNGVLVSLICGLEEVEVASTSAGNTISEKAYSCSGTNRLRQVVFSGSVVY